MADIRYTVEADASRLGSGLRADVEAAARGAAPGLDRLSQRAAQVSQSVTQSGARLERIEAQRVAAFSAYQLERSGGLRSTAIDPAFRAAAYGAPRLALVAGAGAFIAQQESDRAAREGAFTYTGSGLGTGFERSGKEADSLREKILRVNRATQVYMRIGAAAGAAVAGSMVIAGKAAAAYDAQYTQANHTTAATSAAWRNLKSEFVNSIGPGVAAVDQFGAALLRGAKNALEFKDNLIGLAIHGKNMRDVMSAEAADEAAAKSAALNNKLSLIEARTRAELASVTMNDEEAFAEQRRFERKGLAISLNGQLADGSISQAEYQKQLDSFDTITATRLGKMRSDAIEKSLREDQEGIENMLSIRDEWLLSQKEAVERATEESARRAQEQRDAWVRMDEILRSAEADATLEEAKITESRLRGQGKDDEADRVRIRAAYEHERRRVQQQYGGLIDRALTDATLKDGERQDMVDRAQEAMVRILRTLTQRETIDLEGIGRDDLPRDIDFGRGLVVAGGASDVVKGRVFGSANPEAKVQRDHLEQAKKQGETLARIERNTRRRGGYGP